MGIFRFLLAVSVFLYHSDKYINVLNGIVAVHAFFIISGFYIALILSEKYKKSSYWTYISNRILRIYPLYWIILSLTIIFYYLVFYIRGGGPIPELSFTKYSFLLYPTYWGFLSDASLVLFRGYLFVFPIHLPIVSSAWSLVLEVFFYLLAPILIRLKSFFLFVLLLGSVIIRYILLLQQTRLNNGDLGGFFPANLCFFILGIFAYRIYKNKKFYKSKPFVYYLFSIIIITIFLWGQIPNLKLYEVLVKEVFLYLGIFLLIPGLFNLFRISYLDKILGDLSYPIYISHVLILMILKEIQPVWQNTWALMSLYIIITLVLSYFLYYYVDRPINKIRQKRVSPN
jgi:peptidoglycan/LPS O-acetylase OafA/YrhL